MFVPTTYINQLRPLGDGALSASTTPFRLAAPEPRSRRRANSESLRRRWRAVLNELSTVGCASEVRMGSSFSWGRMWGGIADEEEGRRLGLVVPDDWADNPGSAGVDGGGKGPGGLSDKPVWIEEREPLEITASGWPRVLVWDLWWR